MADNAIQGYNPTININDIAGFATLKEGITIEALVKEVLANNNYILNDPSPKTQGEYKVNKDIDYPFYTLPPD